MNKINILLLFLLTFCNIYSQKSVYDIARSGKLQEMKNLDKKHPNSINSVDKNGFTPLILACYRGNNEVATYLVQHVKDINYNSPNGTALMASVVKGNIEMVKKLIEKKADVNAVDVMGNPALYYAITFKNYEIIKILLNAHAKKELENKDGNSMVFYAIQSNDEKIKTLFDIK